MRVLVACEESQTVTNAFRNLGHEAFSCDIIPCSGGHPEWHIQDDVTKHLDKNWDLMIAHPPCTFLAVSGACRMYNKDGSVNQTRKKNQDEALAFVRMLLNAPIRLIAVENPISVISTKIRKPDQIVHPWMFGHPESKSTCLWLKGLPKLIPTKVLTKPSSGVWSNQTPSGQNRLGPSANRAKLRSKTYSGIAEAMAQQWSIL
jgi:hypothetical protein